MGLFQKKTTIEELIEKFKNLTDEEKESFLSLAVSKEEETDTEGENVPEESTTVENASSVTEDAETSDNATEEDAATSEENGVSEDPPAEAGAESTEPTAEPDKKDEENAAEIIAALTSRIQALEQTVSEFSALKEKMDEFVEKQKESFGYKSKGSGAHKDIEDMSADELKAHILNN